MLIKEKNNENEEIFCLEKVIILNIHKKGNPFDINFSETRLSIITLDDELHKHISLNDMGKYYVLLKSKPEEEYIKVSIDTFVAKGKYCKDCKYRSNSKIFNDEYLNSHDASCFLFLTYLDYDREIGEMIKCEKCRKITG